MLGYVFINNQRQGWWITCTNIVLFFSKEKQEILVLWRLKRAFLSVYISFSRRFGDLLRAHYFPDFTYNAQIIRITWSVLIRIVLFNSNFSVSFHCLVLNNEPIQNIQCVDLVGFRLFNYNQYLCQLKYLLTYLARDFPLGKYVVLAGL